MPITKTESIRPSLLDPYLKTTRAKEHLDSLRQELDAFRETKPYTLTCEDDIERGLYRIRFKMEDAPHRIPLIAGDLFYCLRSSLDQLVFALASLSIPLPEGTQFPILDKLNSETRARFKNQTVGVPADARDIIESLQPYHGPNTAAIRSRLLWRLNALCNLDKHRRIPVHGVQTTARFPHAHKSIAPFIAYEKDNIVSVPLRFKSQMTLDPCVTYEVIFGDMYAVTCDFDGIERIYNFVADSVIPRFQRFFK